VVREAVAGARNRRRVIGQHPEAERDHEDEVCELGEVEATEPLCSEQRGLNTEPDNEDVARPRHPPASCACRAHLGCCRWESDTAGACRRVNDTGLRAASQRNRGRHSRGFRSRCHLCAAHILRSPLLVSKQCSSQKPDRFTWAANDPGSFQSFILFSTLCIAPRYANLHRVRLRWVVLPAELVGVEEHAQNLYVMLGCNAGDDDAHDK
jgi:hypothetical protein